MSAGESDIATDEEVQEPIEINGKRYARHQGTGTVVTFSGVGDEITRSRSIIVPTDWEPDLTNEEILERARRAHERAIFVEEWIEATPEAVTSILTGLREGGIFEAIAAELIGAVETITIEAKLDEDEQAISADELERETLQTQAIVRDEIAAAIRNVLLTGETAADFQADIARGILFDAHAQGLATFEEEGGDLDQNGAYATFWHERAGDFTTPAMLDAFSETLSSLAGFIITHVDNLEPAILKAFEKRLRKLQQKQRRGRGGRPQQREYLRTLGNPLYFDLGQAMATSHGFEIPEGSSWPTKRIGRGKTRADVALRPTALDTDLYPTPEIQAQYVIQMLDLQNSLSPEATWLLDAFTAIHLDKARSPEERVSVRIDDLLAMQGLKRKPGAGGRRGGYTEKQRAGALLAIMQITSAWIVVDQLAVIEEKATGGRQKKKINVEGDRLFHLGKFKGQRDLFDGAIDIHEITFWPSETTARFLYGPWQTIAIQLASLSHYDFYHERVEYLLGRYVAYQWRADSKNGNPPKAYKITTLLEKAGLDLYEPKPSRTRERLEKAFDRLLADGHIAGWQYRDFTEPGRRVGWADDWLNTIVLVECPGAIRDHYATIKRPETKAIASGKAEIVSLAGRLKDTRQRRQLSQMQAAEEADIPQQTYSRAERGDRVSAPTQRKLEAWLASLTGTI